MSKSTFPLPDFIEEAKRIVELAEKESVMLRIIGSVAFHIHCPKYSYLQEKLGREFTDLDFIGRKKQIKNIIKLIEKNGYTSDPNTLLLRRVLGRYKWIDETNNRFIDIFFDKLEMCHTIDFRSRLQLDSPTIPLADLLLEKLQIVKITEKDIIDTIMLLREHKFGHGENDTIDADYLMELLSDDWGFYHTATTNLKKIRDDFLHTYPDLTDKDKADIRTKITAILEHLDQSPKSSRWKKRATVGVTKRWYREVEDI